VIEETVYKGLEPQAQTRIMFTGAFDYGDLSQRTAISTMAGVLRTRLREVLREELGGTYSVGVSSSVSWRPEGNYRLTISFGSDPDRVDELLDAVYAEIDRLHGSPPTEAEVSDVRQAALRTFETNLESNSFWLSQLDGRYRYWLDNLNLRAIYRYPSGDRLLESLLANEASLNAVGPADVQEAARRYFDLSNQVRVTLLPEQSN